MQYTITIDDAAQLAAISWACERHNAPLPEEERCPTDADYLQWLLTSTAANWAEERLQEQMNNPEIRAAVAAALAGDRAPAEALLAAVTPITATGETPI